MSHADLSWQLEANCLEVSVTPDNDPWYPESDRAEWGTIMTPAYRTDLALHGRLICFSCPVMDECRNYSDSIEHNWGYQSYQDHGIWAGESPSERRSRRLAERMNGGSR